MNAPRDSAKCLRLYQVVASAKRSARIRAINLARAPQHLLTQLEERDGGVAERIARVPLEGLNRSAVTEGRLVDIERAVQINAALHRKRAELAAQRARLQEELKPLVAAVTSLHAAERSVVAKRSQLARLLMSAADVHDESEVEERWGQGRR